MASARPQYTQQQIVDALGLVDHPEGGYFRETYRSGATPMASRGLTDPSGTLAPAARKQSEERNTMTSIYYLISRDFSLVCNDSPHMHYWHAGASLAYHLLHPDGKHERIMLGSDVLNGEVPQVLVPGGVYKCAEFIDEHKVGYALLGEAVAPGFDYRDFTFVSQDELSARAAGDQAVTQTLQRFVKPGLNATGKSEA